MSKSKASSLLMKNLLASARELKGTQELHRFRFYSFYPTNQLTKKALSFLSIHPMKMDE